VKRHWIFLFLFDKRILKIKKDVPLAGFAERCRAGLRARLQIKEKTYAHRHHGCRRSRGILRRTARSGRPRGDFHRPWGSPSGYSGERDRPGEIGAVELVLVATKTYHTDEAAQAITPLIGTNTVVISLQNGIDAAERIGATVGMEHIIGGATWLSAALEAPGRIGQYSQFRRIALGELDGRITARAQAIASILATTPAVIELVPNIRQVLWTKFVFIAAISALGGLTRVAIGECRQVPEARDVLTEAMAEVAAVAKASGVSLDADIIGKTLAFIDASAPDIRPSMQRDLEAGRTTELESLIGVVVRLGNQHGVPTPVMGLAYALLKPAHLRSAKG
jgi:2-dehydropantoate 2-reductase